MGTHLVAGAGPVGSETACRLARSGHDVIVLTRSGEGPIEANIRRVAADAAAIHSLSQPFHKLHQPIFCDHSFVKCQRCQ
jgi:nucleoside-diphosphate-sugar epimerase